MRLSTGLFILVSACLLTSCGGGGGGGTTTTQTPLHDIPVKLGCKGDNGDIHIGNKPGTVTFSVPASCTPLKSITPDPPVPGFTGKVISNGTIAYQFHGEQLPQGYPFSYLASGDEQGFVNNGTGVIKN